MSEYRSEAKVARAVDIGVSALVRPAGVRQVSEYRSEAKVARAVDIGVSALVHLAGVHQ